MKKIFLFLLASAGILALASCARTEMEAPVNGDPAETTTLTLSFDATRTQLVDGKTAWAAGDKVRILNSDGKYTVDVEVPESAAGKTSFDVDVKIKDSVYFAVYPVLASDGVVDGKVKINISSSSTGRFADANICAATTIKGTTLALRNVAAIMKLNVNSGNVVEMVQVNSKNPMVGGYTVDFSGAAPALTPVAGDTTKTVSVAIGGVDGDYYVPVAPVEFDPGLSITALRGNGGYQTVTSTVKNTVAVNTIVDLGVIGNNLSSGLSGEGTEASPYIIGNAGEFGAFLASVNLGNAFENKYLRLDIDITEPVTTPIGFSLDGEDFPFSGHFMGNGHKIAVDLEGINSKDPKGQNYIALFGVLGEGASIKDLDVSGTVKATGGNAAGVVGACYGADKNRNSISNVKSSVKVTADGDRVAGIAGYAKYTDFETCENSGEITGNNSVAGIGAYTYYCSITGCTNSAAITSTSTAPTGMYCLMRLKYEVQDNVATTNYNNGTGGIAGFAQNSSLKNVVNTSSAPVKAYMKVGGIAGVTYWTPVEDATNEATVDASGDLNLNSGSINGYQWGSVAGGIVGWLLTYGNITNATNSGKISAKGGMGGIVGVVTTQNNAQSKPVISNCTNNGNIVATKVYVGGTAWTANPGTGGICGAANTYRAYTVTFVDCVNNGAVSASNDAKTAHSVGGILGLSCGGSNAYGGTNYIDRCVNNATVTGDSWVGGIIGLSGASYSTIAQVTNCANHGDVKATGYNSKAAGILAGGIAGGVATYNGNSAKDCLIIKNCYNDGKVEYTDNTQTKPYLGGIVGSCYYTHTVSGKTYFAQNSASLIQNNYNFGYVGPENGKEPAEGATAYIGALAGYQKTSCVHYCYFAQGTNLGSQAAVGSASTVAARTDTVCSYDPADGTLAVNVTANGNVCDKLLDALNGWQDYYVGAGNVYFNWTGAAGHPVFDTTMN